jgi:hypothetical protein
MLRLVLASALLVGLGAHSAHAALNVRVKKNAPRQNKRERKALARQVITHGKLPDLKRHKAISGEAVLQNQKNPVEVLGMKGMIDMVEKEIIELAAKASHVELRQQSSKELQLHTFLKGERTAIVSAKRNKVLIRLGNRTDVYASVKSTVPKRANQSRPDASYEEIEVRLDHGLFGRTEKLETPKGKPAKVVEGTFMDRLSKVLSAGVHYEGYVLSDTGQTRFKN